MLGVLGFETLMNLLGGTLQRSYHLIVVQAASMAFFMMTVLVIMSPSFIMRKLDKTNRAVEFFALPASTKEKYVASWIFIVIGIASIFKRLAVPENLAETLPKLWAPYWVILLPLALGGLLALKMLKNRNTCFAISIVSASLFVTIFLGSFSMNEINKMLGAKEGCLEASRIAEQKQKPLLYYSFSAAPNMDYYFKQNGQQILISLRSGESMILQTFNKKGNFQQMARMEDEQKAPVKTYDLNGKWTLSFVD
jgi:hypothetical protein